MRQPYDGIRVDVVIGHSYLSPSTECWRKIAEKYFVHGELPEDLEVSCDAEPESRFPGLEVLPLPMGQFH